MAQPIKVGFTDKTKTRFSLNVRFGDTRLDALKNEIAVRWASSSKRWTTPASAVAALRIAQLFQGDVRLTPDCEMEFRKLHSAALKMNAEVYSQASKEFENFARNQCYYKTRPKEHQFRAMALMYSQKKTPLFIDCGGGKTATVLCFLHTLREFEKYQGKEPRRLKALVVGKLMTLNSAWAEDTERFTDFTYSILWQSSERHKEIHWEVDRECTLPLWADVEKQNRKLSKEDKIQVKTVVSSWLEDANGNTIVCSSRDHRKHTSKPGVVTKYSKVKLGSDGITYGPRKNGVLVKDEDIKKSYIKEQLSRNDVDVFIINHDGARLYESLLDEVQFDFIAVDESTVIKTHDASITKSLCKIGDHSEYRFILSGTPAPNGPEDLWSQFFFLDGGLTLGAHHHGFMAKYYDMIQKKVSRGKGPTSFVEWELKPAAIKELRRLVASRQFRIRLRDCADLPPLTTKRVWFSLGEDQKKVYQEMRENLAATLTDATGRYNQPSIVEAKTDLVKIMKLRQITGGFVTDEEGSPRPTRENAKMEALLDTFSEFAPDEPVVIFAVYRWEIQQLLKSIPGSRAIYGDVSAETRIKNVDDFKAGKFRVVICQPQSAAHGLTFVNARYLMFYSYDYSAELNYQALKRIERMGQTRAMFVYYFVASKTIDNVIYNVIQKKNEMQMDLIDSDIGEAQRFITAALAESLER